MEFKPRLLLVSPVTPSHNGPGVNQRAALHVTAMSKLYEVHLIIVPLYVDNVVTEIPNDMSSLCQSVTVIQPMSKSPLLSSKVPFALALNEYIRPDARIVLPDNTSISLSPQFPASRQFDAALFFRTSTGDIAQSLLHILGATALKMAVDFDDIESSYLARQRALGRQRNGLQYDLMLKVQQMRQRRLEDTLLSGFDVVSICSDKDRELLNQRKKTAEIAVLPNCIIPPKTEETPRSSIYQILFVGTLSYAPNEDGIVYFCNEVLPLIRKMATREYAVAVVGYNPSSKVLKLGELPDVTVHGGVDDVGEYYEMADLVIAPIRFGAGTRIKILEAMAYAKPVVSTTLGAEGITTESGTTILLADTPEDFAGACHNLMTSAEKSDKMGRQGLEFVKSEFSISKCYAELFVKLGKSVQSETRIESRQ